MTDLNKRIDNLEAYKGTRPVNLLVYYQDIYSNDILSCVHRDATGLNLIENFEPDDPRLVLYVRENGATTKTLPEFAKPGWILKDAIGN